LPRERQKCPYGYFFLPGAIFAERRRKTSSGNRGQTTPHHTSNSLKTQAIFAKYPYGTPDALRKAEADDKESLARYFLFVNDQNPTVDTV
jgi:hypothetical protein